jgi:hypothetical protein
MEQIIIIGFLVLLIIITRLIPSIIYNRPSHDSFFYLLYSKKLKKKILYNKKIDILYDDPLDYSPPLYPIFLIAIPNKLIKFTPILFEIINFGIFYFIFKTLFPEKNILLFALLFILYPLYTSIYSGPRTYHPTPRLLTEILFNLNFLCIFMYLQETNIFWFISACIVGSGILLNSKFGTQVFIFFYIPLGIFTKITEFFTIFFLTFLLAFILSKGQLYNYIKQHIIFLINYAKKVQFNHPVILIRNKSKIKILLKEGFLKFLKSLLIDSDAFNYFIKNYLATLVIIFILFKGYNYDIFFVYWFLISIILFTITSTKYFRFLGESERYLFYGVIPLFIILIQYEFLFLIYIGFIIWSIIYWFITVLIVYFTTKNKKIKNKYDNIVEISKYIKNKNYNNILVLQKNHAWEIMFLTNKKFCGFFSKKELNPQFYIDMRLPLPNLLLLRKHYNFDVIILNKKFKNHYKNSFKTLKEVFNNEDYKVFIFKNSIYN